jgi:hypothetical protein
MRSSKVDEAFDGEEQELLLEIVTELIEITEGIIEQQRNMTTVSDEDLESDMSMIVDQSRRLLFLKQLRLALGGD